MPLLNKEITELMHYQGKINVKGKEQELNFKNIHQLIFQLDRYGHIQTICSFLQNNYVYQTRYEQLDFAQVEKKEVDEIDILLDKLEHYLCLARIYKQKERYGYSHSALNDSLSVIIKVSNYLLDYEREQEECMN